MRANKSINIDIQLWQAVSDLAKEKKTGISQIMEEILYKDKEIQKKVGNKPK